MHFAGMADAANENGDVDGLTRKQPSVDHSPSRSRGAGPAPKPRRGDLSPRTPRSSLAVWGTTPPGDCRCWRAETEAREGQEEGWEPQEPARLPILIPLGYWTFDVGR